ncbi:hypothetical protein CYY_000788 [Polysphondylium violaceum]|uniref:Uncharacterized protein n=1 Tax=Polysphondylium violaceum TaxID=133409 RepID=A0A8J4V246_9MYCE|nr:hypothetical protein CYY_000788 [Polysphondylium violaceum]
MSSTSASVAEIQPKISDFVSITPYLKLETSFQSLFLFLYLLKIIYLVKIERKNNGFQLKLWVHIICFFYNFFNGIANSLVFISKTSVQAWLNYVTFVVLVLYLIVLASALLLFLHWVSLITDVLSVTKGGKVLTRNNGILFFGVFFIPNLILSIIFYIIAMWFQTKVNFNLLMKVQQYFLLGTVCLVTFILWGFLVYQMIIMNPVSRNSAKKFFIMAFLFSTTTVLVILFQVIIAFSPPSNILWCVYLNIITCICFHLQVLFTVFPINIHKIRKYYNPQYVEPSLRHSQISPKNSNSEKNISLKKVEPEYTCQPANISVGNIQP